MTALGMTNPNGIKGRVWERLVRKFLAERFGERHVRHPRQQGYKDVGDLHLGPFVLQCKDDAKHDFSGWLADVEEQRLNARESFGVVVVKRRRHATEDGYVLMTLDTFRDLAEAVLGQPDEWAQLLGDTP